MWWGIGIVIIVAFIWLWTYADKESKRADKAESKVFITNNLCSRFISNAEPYLRRFGKIDNNDLTSVLESIKYMDSYINEILGKVENDTIKSIATLYADFKLIEDRHIEEFLRIKPRPAVKAADLVKEMRVGKDELIVRERLLTYTLDMLCNKYNISRQEVSVYVDCLAPFVASDHRENLYEVENLYKRLHKAESQLAIFNSDISYKDRLQQGIQDLTVRYENKLKYYKEFPEWTIPETIKKIASLYADIETIDNKLVENYLRNKKQPALKAADEIKVIRKEKREALRQLKEMQYEYDWLLQQLPDYADSTQDVIEEIEAIASEGDEVELWLSKEEWQSLSTIEKNQLALDRYNQRRKKSNRRIGYDYELYCGHYIYKGELLGGRGIGKIVQYGIENGLEDRGRDIIAEGNGMVYVIQCKCWRKERPIRENTIMQLYGSAAEYCFSQYESEPNPLKRLHKTVIPVLITTTTLSEVAARFAKYLGIEVVEFKFDKPYPQIKCNIGRDGEKIYHLPFDQQYDTTIIERHRGECFVSTVQEAEDLGFRHAMRHTLTQG